MGSKVTPTPCYTMTAHTQDIAGFVDHWLSTETTPNQVLWVIVENREDGVDLARALFRAQFGDFAGREVPFDSIPTYAANAATMNRAFILADNDEIAETGVSHYDTVLVTMHEEQVMGEMFGRDVSASEAQFMHGLASGRLDDFRPEYVEYLKNDTRPDQVSTRAPDLVFVDVEWPAWDRIRANFGGHTRLMTTDRVRTQPPMKSPEAQLQEELSRRLFTR
jgi:hypothetical protein